MAGNQTSGDESAPLFFILAILLCIVVPWTLVVIWGIIYYGSSEVQEAFPEKTEDGERVRQCQTQVMVDRRDSEVKRMRSRSRLFGGGFIARMVILGLLWCWLAYIVVQFRAVMATSKLYVDFEPYSILGVSRGTSKADMKKAYRKLAVQLHPDRNMNDPTAADKFMLVKKAMDALTDPIAKRNYERYGNPDGPSRVEVGMAIPSVSKENQSLVLVLFVIFFIIGVPCGMVWLMSESESNAPGVVRSATMEALGRAMTPSLDVRAAQELMLQCNESHVCPDRPGEAEFFVALRKELPAIAGKSSKASKKTENAEAAQGPNPKAELLLLCHFCRRRDLLTGDVGSLLAGDLDSLLRSWRGLALAIANLAAQYGFGESVTAAITLHRCIVQALEPGAPTGASVASLLQTPHFTVDRVKAWRKGPRKNAGLPALLDLSAEEQKASLASCELDAQELADVAEFAAVMPRLVLKSAEVSVVGEDQICQGDLGTLTVRLERSQLGEGEAAGSAHTPLFPSAAVTDAWWLIFTPPGRETRARCVRLAERGRVIETKLKFKVPFVTKCRCKITVLSEAFEGLDIEEKISFETSAPKEDMDDASDHESSDGELSGHDE